MLELQNLILEMVARGEPLKVTTDRLCAEVQALLPDVTCSVLSVDRAGLIHPLSGPDVPRELCELVDGMPIGPMVGSCGSAAYFNHPVSVTDIATDARWDLVRHAVIPAGLAACWSTPIADSDGRVLGAFAFYYRERRGPNRREEMIVATCINLCAIAIERHERVLERERRAAHDELTGLGNRASFNALLARMSCVEPGNWGLLILDLDNLKTVNDTFGHHAGDCLLQVAAARLAAAAAPDLAFRLGGDEFVIMLQSRRALADLDAAATRILDDLSQPAQCGGYCIEPEGTIGGATLSVGDDNPEVVRQNADYALYHAKKTGRGGFVRYWPGLGTAMTDRLRAIREVETALRDDRIDAWYQPMLCLETGALTGFEALCRLVSPTGEIRCASEFREATSDVQISFGLTQRMLAIVAGDMAKWIRAGFDAPRVAINVSAADLHGNRLETALRSTFGAVDVPLDRLTIEITESTHLKIHDEVLQRAIRSLRAFGLQIAIDDFGTGYASLTNLLAAQIDSIKIDPSLVRRATSGGAMDVIVAGLIGIAHGLGIRVTAEGIESREQAAHLRELGCRHGQGHYFSAAVDRARATDMLGRFNFPLAGDDEALTLRAIGG